MSRGKSQSVQKDYIPYRLGTVDNDDEHIYISGSIDILRQLLTVTGARTLHVYDSVTGEDTGLTYIIIEANRTNFMVVEALAIPDEISQGYIRLRNLHMTTSQQMIDDWLAIAPVLKPGRTLKDFQMKLCAFGNSIPCLFNASEQGTGKTITSIAMIGAWKPLKTLIIVPKSIIWQWNSEFTNTLQMEEGTDGVFHIIPLDVSVKESATIVNDLHYLEEAGEKVVVITNYEKIQGLTYALLKWKPDVIIIDESWRIKNLEADVTKRIIILSDIAERIILLNGTPFGQDVSDLWPQLRATSITKGYDLPSYDTWKASFAITNNAGYGRAKLIGVRSPQTVMQYMAPRFARATKLINIPELPEKYEPIQVEIPFTGELADFYLHLSDVGDSVYQPLSLNGDRVAVIRQQQLLSGIIPRTEQRLFNQKEAFLKKYPQAGRQKHTLVQSPKRDYCIQYAKDIMLGNPQMRVIFWCKFTLTIQALTEALMGVLGNNAVFPVTGTTDGRELEEIKASFNSRSVDGIRALVVQTQKMAYGQNLQGCDWNILYDHSWSYIERDQLEDRSHRMGRQGPVGYTELVSVIHKNGKEYKTIDHDILKAIKEREQFAKRFGPDTTNNWDDDL